MALAGTSHAQTATSPEDGLIARGHSIATMSDCSACHTAPGSHDEMAGGYGIVSPLGTIFSSNITPSKTAGIGAYSEEDFSHAVRDGIGKSGEHLYPAMPYTAYQRINDDDMHALYTYFMRGVKPVDKRAPSTDLPFPFNIRASMIMWNLLFSPDPLPATIGALTDEEKRGEYLANALAHCGTCHTPRNVAMAAVGSQSFAGGQVGSWIAPNITPDAKSGVGSWSDQELADYLKTGRAVGRAQAAGPMAEAVEHSFQHLDDADIHAIVAYMRKVEPVSNASVDRSAVGTAHSDDNVVRGLNVESGEPLRDGHLGATIYAGNCAACHGTSGAGSYQQFYPSLTHNSVVGALEANNLVSVIIGGVHRDVGGHVIEMPAFGPTAYVNRLSYAEIASLTNYLTETFGQGNTNLTDVDVQRIAQGGPQPIIAYAGIASKWGLAVIALIVIAAFTWRRTRKNQRKEA
jgi:mono/diheme cytochrome c family protein